MKNTHKKQLINPDKIFRMLQTLKDNGSPFHQNLMTPADFRMRCHETDKTGYKTVYGEEEDEALEDLDELPGVEPKDELTNENSEDGEKESDEDDDIDEEDESLKKDPIKKYHFAYDESLCMMDKYPEITIAPGEGQRPKGILGDKHWDMYPI